MKVEMMYRSARIFGTSPELDLGRKIKVNKIASKMRTEVEATPN